MFVLNLCIFCFSLSFIYCLFHHTFSILPPLMLFPLSLISYPLSLFLLSYYNHSISSSPLLLSFPSFFTPPSLTDFLVKWAVKTTLLKVTVCIEEGVKNYGRVYTCIPVNYCDKKWILEVRVYKYEHVQMVRL